jgi:alanyl-tRNA synthetase
MGKEELHTAEHIFARALQNLGVDLHVIKVDTENGAVGNAIFNEKIGPELLWKAEREVNAVVSKGWEVSEEACSSLDEAKAKYPKLRMREERLEGKETFRLVMIGDYDYSMCKNRHVGNTSQIRLFTLKNVSYPESHTKIEFLAAEDAVEYLLGIGDGAIGAGIAHNFEPVNLPKMYEKGLQGYAESEAELSTFVEAMLKDGKRVFKVEGIEISKFYKVLRKYIDKNDESYVVFLNERQLLCLWGSKCKTDMAGLGKALLDSSQLTGAVKEGSINGRIKDSEKAYGIIDRFLKG